MNYGAVLTRLNLKPARRPEHSAPVPSIEIDWSQRERMLQADAIWNGVGR